MRYTRGDQWLEQVDSQSHIFALFSTYEQMSTFIDYVYKP